MRLLNSYTFELEEFPNRHRHTIPDYAILSHTWEEKEPSFHDMQKSKAEGMDGYTKMAGYTKITWCCSQARLDGFEYVWIDTCCIDKTSSSELSEAINSMYQWYQNAQVCYAYLTDVPSGEDY